jgi:protein TonB
MGYQALLFCPDEKTARTVTQVLSELDFTIEPCSEPFAAVKKLMAQHFDAVVVDCDNEQNATLLFKSARNSNSNQSSLAVAVVEGQAGVAKAFRIGANLVLTKPINVEQAKGTLRVARGLLRKGAEPPKAGTATVATPPAPAAKPAAPPSRPASPSVSSVSPVAATRKPSAPMVPINKPAPPAPSIAASAPVLDLDDQDSILDPDNEEPMTAPPAFEAKPVAPPPAPSVTGTSKFPWQPSPKMAEPMASALRRAAEAAGQVEPVDEEPVMPPVVQPSVPEKRAMSGAMFQAQGHAAAPARAPEKPAVAASTPVIEEPVAPKKAAVQEIAEPPGAKFAAIDSTRDDVPPPTFFPGAYDADETEGGGKTKALLIVAAVVLLACSAGYLSWKNSGSKSSAPTANASSAPASAANTPAPENTPARTSAPDEQPEATDITVGSSPANTHSSTSTASSKPAGKPSAAVTEAPDEPEVTQRLIVKNDARHVAPQPAPQESEPVQAPSAIGLATSVDTKSLAALSSTGSTATRATPQLLRVSQGVMEGLVLKRVQPRYPTQALQMRIQGPVQLQATISKTGDIENLKVVSGDTVLGRAAVEAVRQWKYKPYYLNGDPVQIETQILVNFRLPN